MFLKRPMPKFAIYSRLDKGLLKKMLIKATTIQDDDIIMLKQMYFNVDKPDEHH